jgi:hypothetical protein
MWTMDVQEILLWLALAFCGGMFGASVGGLCSFVFCGVGALVASAFMLSGHTELANWTDAWVTWGPFVGAQTAFVGGGWAAVYARYHAGFENGRDICKPLAPLNRPDVLIVGGLGGVCGAFMTWLFWLLPSYTVGGQAVASCNSVACGVAVAAMIGRLLYGRTGLFGKVPQGVGRWVGSKACCWIPWQHDSGPLLLLALAVGLPSAVLAFANPGTHLMMFGIMTMLYLFMVLGQGVIAGHHFAICAYFAVAVTGNVAWGLAFAVLCGFATEIFAFTFTAYGDSHIDPPTVGIMACGLIQPFLLWSGLMPYAPHTVVATAGQMKSLAALFAPGGDLSGLIALAVVTIGMPLVLKGLRQLPAKPEELFMCPQNAQLAVEEVEAEQSVN